MKQIRIIVLPILALSVTALGQGTNNDAVPSPSNRETGTLEQMPAARVVDLRHPTAPC